MYNFNTNNIIEGVLYVFRKLWCPCQKFASKNGLTQNQVAESLGVTPGYISNVENNRTAMSLRILTYYARLIGCSLDALVGELDSEYSETALDRKLYQTILKLDIDTKEKLLKTLEIWTK